MQMLAKYRQLVGGPISRIFARIKQLGSVPWKGEQVFPWAAPMLAKGASSSEPLTPRHRQRQEQKQGYLGGPGAFLLHGIFLPPGFLQMI